MITLLHGDHIASSRAELNRAKLQSQGREVRIVDGKTFDPATLVQSLESSSLFGGSILVVVEQLFSRLSRQVKKQNEYAQIIAGAGSQTDIIIWEDKELGAGVIKQLGQGVTIRLFKLPILIFQFLDTFNLSTFERLMETEAPELVFSMLVKRVRQLMQVASKAAPESLAGWQLARLTTQAKSFTMDELISLYEQLGDAEYAIKSGSSPFTFRQLLEQVLITI